MTTNIVIGAAIGLVLGFFVHRKVVAKDPIHGGIVATALHYLSAAVFSSTVPSVLLTVFTGLGFWTAIAYGLSCAVLSLILLTAHAAIDYAPRNLALARAEEGWTAEKAKTSGL
ncbi:MAG: hypothetical protein SGI73_02390 [Chloroflexota bacterium]|nr:hypothetical protein [Chloroflexota bacterium]